MHFAFYNCLLLLNVATLLDSRVKLFSFDEFILVFIVSHLKACMPFPDSLWSPQVDFGIFNQADANGQITPFVEKIHTFDVTELDLKKDKIIC